MNKLELVKVALRELGNASAHDLSSFIARTKGVMIEPKNIPHVQGIGSTDGATEYHSASGERGSRTDKASGLGRMKEL
jgi:hypothetical protein